MATLQLQVEVDSDVHPELYAALAAVARAGLRPERLRQLAASGLIWEHLRVKPRNEASTALQPLMAESAPAPVREAPPVLNDVVQLPVAVERRSAPRVEPVPAPVEPPDEPPMDEEPAIELVGLEPASPPGAAGTAGPRARLMRMKASGLFNNG